MVCMCMDVKCRSCKQARNTTNVKPHCSACQAHADGRPFVGCLCQKCKALRVKGVFVSTLTHPIKR